MSQTVPYEQNNYLGEFTGDSAALAAIQADKWDTNGDGTGNPQEGMWYVNTTSNLPRAYLNGTWVNINFDGDAFHDNVAGEIAALTPKVSVDDDDWLLIEDSIDSDNKKAIKASNFLSGVTQFATQLAFTGVTTSTSTTDVLIPGLTHTPGAGTYMVFAGGSINLSVKNRNMWVSIYANGVKNLFSEIEFQPGEADAYVPFAITGILVTVGGGEAIDIRWRRDAGNPAPTMRLQNRHLTLVQVL